MIGRTNSRRTVSRRATDAINTVHASVTGAIIGTAIVIEWRLLLILIPYGMLSYFTGWNEGRGER